MLIPDPAFPDFDVSLFCLPSKSNAVATFEPFTFTPSDVTANVAILPPPAVFIALTLNASTGVAELPDFSTTLVINPASLSNSLNFVVANLSKATLPAVKLLP